MKTSINFHTLVDKPKRNGKTFKPLHKQNQIFWFPCCSTREDLSVDVSITHVGLILTKPGRFFSWHTETRGTDRIQFRHFELFEKFSHFWVSML